MRGAGEVPEWSIGTVSKTVVRVCVPWVRIPPSPPTRQRSPLLSRQVSVVTEDRAIAWGTVAAGKLPDPCRIAPGPRMARAASPRTGVPYGIRTRVTNVKGWCPGPLDERDSAPRAGQGSAGAPSYSPGPGPPSPRSAAQPSPRASQRFRRVRRQPPGGLLHRRHRLPAPAARAAHPLFGPVGGDRHHRPAARATRPPPRILPRGANRLFQLGSEREGKRQRAHHHVRNRP